MSLRLDALLVEACARAPQASALADPETMLTFGALADAARQTAAALRGIGLMPDEPVLVPVANAPQDIAAFIGVWLAGGVVVPVARHAPAAAIEATRAATAARLSVPRAGEAAPTGDHRTPPARPLLKDAAIIIFTSGSTGDPKGVVLGHDQFARKLMEIDGVLGFSPATRSLPVLQITFVFGIWVTLLTLLKGGTTFMRLRADPATVAEDIAVHGITDAAFVPTMLRRLVAADRAALAPQLARGNLKRIHTGGEPFSPALGQRLRELFPHAEIMDIFGLTETASSDFFLPTTPGKDFAGGIGRISRSERFRIADAEGHVLPPGEVGELQIATPFAMNGYLDRPDLTVAAFADGYFRTGDLAFVRPDGSVELAGRAKDLIVKGGAKISPLELDGLIAQHPAVAAALTVGVPDAIVGERIHVLVVPRGAEPLAEDALRHWVAERLERFKRPDVYHFGAELPTGRTGKVDRGALRNRLAALDGGAAND
ncbi:MAG: class I adenylate-forming enzyme family protein [Pseudolabrys sp.]